jgi:hypothetical protein
MSIKKRTNASEVANDRLHRLKEGPKLIPTWAKSNAQVQRLLRFSFPKRATDKRQANEAARWERIIERYYQGRNSKGSIIWRPRRLLSYLEMINRAHNRMTKHLPNDLD